MTDYPEAERDADLSAIRSAYAAYDDQDRSRLWSLDNPGYARGVAEVRRALVSAMTEVLDGPRNRVLDVGCGDGSLYGEMRAAGLDVDWSGIDLRAEPIDRARRDAPEADWRVASADRLPFADASFDVAVARVLFSSLPSDALEKAVATEIRRVVRPGGALVWFDLRYRNPTNPHVRPIDRHRLETLFPGSEISVRPVLLAPPVARRLGRLTSILYPILASIPPLRSHLVGYLRLP